MRELALIEAISGALARRDGSRVVRWLGDDAAVVRGDAFAVTSVDVMVDGTHFRLGQASPADIGHRALAAALSERLYYEMEAPVLRVTGFDTPYPPSRLEEGYLPDLDRVLHAVDRSLAY